MSKPKFEECAGPTCLSCQIKMYQKTHGEWPSVALKSHATMWGCTCSPEAKAEATAAMKVVTA